MIILIAAIGKNRELGKDNKLIWHLKKDLLFFKEKTNNHIIVMGKNTFNSLPKILPNRIHYVLSSKCDFNKELNDKVRIFNNKENLIKECIKIGKDEDIFIVGGASIYKMFIDLADKMYLTIIDSVCADADVFFPEISEKWESEVLSDSYEDGINFSHIKYFQPK